MRVIVTGGAGFIGTNLCRRLVADGHEVISLDIADPLWPVAGVEYRRHDVALESAAWTDCGLIYHLACPASPPDYMRRPIETLRTAVMGTINALECAERRGARIVIASTSEVYGDPTESPQKEGYHGNVNPFGPRAVYDEGKRAAEAACYAMLGKVSFGIVRIFNTYGPFMRPNDGRMVPEFIKAAISGKPLPIFGGGQRRSLCYVDDLVEGLVRMANAPGICGPINLGNPDERTVEAWAGLIVKLTGDSARRLGAHRKAIPTDDPMRRRPDIERAQLLLGWQPTVTAEEGLRRTVDWFRGVLS